MEPCHIHQWSIGRPILVASNAMQLAASAEMAMQMLAWARTGDAVRKIREEVGLADWQHFYHEPDSLLAGLADVLGGAGASPSMTWLAQCGQTDEQSVTEATALLDSAPAVAIDMTKEYLREILKQTYRDNLYGILDWLSDQDDGIALTDQDMARPEIQFLLLVFLPCVLETGEMPKQLYERAKAGKNDALTDLIRIDKTIISDPDISAQLQKPTMDRDPVLSEIIGKAFGDGVNYDPSPGQIKGQLGAGIIKSSQSMGWKLGPKNVRGLFDAIQRDKSGDENAVDDDLPDFDEGWRQAIRRGKERWKIKLPRDAFSSDSRYASFLKHLLVSAGDAEGQLPTWVSTSMQQASEPK